MRRRNTASSNTYRFFVAPETICGNDVLVRDEALAHQIGSVLRLQPSAQVTLLDDSGLQYLVALTRVERRQVAGVVLASEPAGGEPQVQLTLYQATLRAERFEWILQKGVEVGIVAFVPVICERSLADETGIRKQDRWRRIVREAAEQSRRGRLPSLAAPLAFADACTQAAQAEQAFLLYEGEAPPLREVLRQALLAGQPASVALVSGPEGGLSSDEVELARNTGLTAVSLGPRILRAETAPLVAASALLYELGELGS